MSVRVLLASEGRRFTTAAIDRAAHLAAPDRPIDVMSIARVWGSGFGFPNPWLMPSRQELDAQHAIVNDAVCVLTRRGLKAAGRIIGTRDAARRILREARALGAEVIVMAADPKASWLLSGLLWSQEPYRVARKAAIPVILET